MRTFSRWAAACSMASGPLAKQRTRRTVCGLAIVATATAALVVANQDGPRQRALAAESTAAPAESAVPRSARNLITPASRRSAQKGLEWIVSAMRHDGTIGPDAYAPPDLSCTAIVGLAFLAEGSTPTGGTYAKESQRILYGVIDLAEQRLARPYVPENSSLVQRKIGANADCFLAALYLAQVYGESPTAERTIRPLLEKLVQRISETQGTDGTWGNESWAPVLGTVLGWESLRAASSSGFRVDASADLAGQALLKMLQTKHAGNEQSWMHNFYKDSSSLRVLYSMHQRENAAFQESVERLINIAQTDRRPFRHAGGEEFLAFYLVTECLIKEPRPEWDPWYPQVRDHLVRYQNRDGSWSGHHCITDRTFCTAAALMTLLAPNQCLPISDL